MANIASKVFDYDRNARGGVKTHTLRSTPNSGGGNITSVFPRKGLGAADPRDELMRMKSEMVAAGSMTGMTPYGEVTVTEEDLAWIRKKRDVEEKLALDRWIGSNFHTDDVTTRAWLQKVYPEYYEVREQEMVDQAKFALRVNLLLLRGPQNQEDLVLFWALQQGLIELEPDWNVIGPNSRRPDMTVEQARFQGGLMNPRKYKSDSERDRNAKAAYNPFAPRGSQAQQNSMRQAGLPGINGSVPDKDRYPTFLKNVIQRAAYGGPGPAGVPNVLGGGGGGGGPPPLPPSPRGAPPLTGGFGQP